MSAFGQPKDVGFKKPIKFAFNASKSGILSAVASESPSASKDQVSPNEQGSSENSLSPSSSMNVEEQTEMEKVMGFGTFGRVKKDTDESEAKDPSPVATSVGSKHSSHSTVGPRKFAMDDLDKLVQQTKKTARILTNKPLEEEKKKDDESESSDDSDSFVGPPLPSASKTAGNKFSNFKRDSEDQKNDDEADGSDEDDDVVGPPLPPGFGDNAGDEEDEADVSSNDEVDDDDYGIDAESRYAVLPVTHELELQHGCKTVSALAIDPNGSRCVSGGVDYEVRFWDFQGMDSTLQPFRCSQPCECHPIKNVGFSNNGELILVVSGATQAKLIDRDGFVKGETVRGDQYISDMKNTKGHVAMLNDGTWHPRERSTFITCSNDGTVRVWNAESISSSQISVIKTRSSTGLRAAPNVCRYSGDGRLIAAGCTDGSIQVWDTRRGFVNTAQLVRDAHTRGSDTSSLCYSYDSNYIATRGTDETLKLWDARKLKDPVHVAKDLFNRFAMTDCSFSPDDKLVMTGISLDKKAGDQYGKLMFFDRDTFERKYEMPVAQGSIIRSEWHPKLNQIFVGCSNGTVKVYYHPERSDRGAKLCSDNIKKKRTKYRDSFEMVQPQIITPHSLPMFKEERRKSHKVRELKIRKDPKLSKRPELPITGPGQGGRLAHAGSTFASYIARNIAKRNEPEMDPREAILRHADECAKNPYWVAPAYAATQPKAVFREEEEQEEDSDDDGPSASKKPHVPV